LRQLAFAQEPARVFLRAPFRVQIGAWGSHQGIFAFNPALNGAEVMLWFNGSRRTMSRCPLP
jgi:hypothetical protein